ncbi:zinc transporter ZIP10 isoform X2 [Danio aesculapii]|nr:zinc transporter ZIP10 isoform X2 [Danio aesculapii]
MMRVHTHTRLCFLCVLTLLYHQCSHCHEGGSHHHHGHNHGDHDHIHSDLQISEMSCNGLSDRLVHGSKGEPAENEQRYYIHQLFCRYGQKDRLDFKGFQSLLLSLGLGEVRVVGLEHEDLGHDHVAHLDILEVQDGRHSHSAGHPHSHQNPNISHKTHQHSHHENEEHGLAEDVPCSKTLGTGATPPSISEEHDHDHEHEHDHDHDKDSDHEHNHRHATDNPQTQDHEHDHIHLHTHSHKQDSDVTQRLEHDHDQKSREHAQENNDLSDQNHHHHDHHHHKHPHPHLHAPDSVVHTTSALPKTQPSVPPELPANQTRRHRRPPKVKDHRGRNRTSITVTQAVELETSGDDHEHSVQDQSPAQQRRGRREVPGSPAHGILHQHEECLNLTQLLHQYGLSSDSLISPVQFTYLCPALLYQIDRRFCILHYHHVEAEEQVAPSSAWVWMWGFVSITIISLLSLLGVVLVPILNQSCFKFLLTFLVALAVGTLSGDALLHLLPHSQGDHDHNHGEHMEEEPEVNFLIKFDGVWKGLTALAGIYLLFIIEHCIGMFKHYSDQRGGLCHKKKKGEQAKIGRKLSDHKLNRRSDAEWLHLKPLTEGDGTTCEAGHNDTQMTELQPLDSPSKMPLNISDSDHPYKGPVKTEEDNLPKGKSKKHGHGHGHGHGHSHHGHCHSDQEMKDAGIASIAWMVIMGDGMHNFSDGLAIGAAFSANITGGISTSVAVFCHELPHELGDFAVLLKAGMSVKQAIVYNLLSALMAYVGMVIGTAVGQYTHNVTSWIFAVTAGMFLYVALVDMLPEMLHGDSEEHKRCEMGHFVLQNFGMLTGFGIMLLIAIFEDHIVLDFGF